MEVNKQIYDTNYSETNLRLAPATGYDRRMIALRFALLRRYGTGRDVLDLCCGTGSYLLPMLGEFRSATGVDFSAGMLEALKKAAGTPPPRNLTLREEDARRLSIPAESVDLVYSFASLYHVPDLPDVLSQVYRVLRPGGHAVLELGNRYSLNTLVSGVQYRIGGWAKPYHVPAGEMRRSLARAGFGIVRHRAFQLLPMYGTPRPLLPLAPLLSPLWKKILGVTVGGTMLDELISSAPPLRSLAFRHLFIARKQ